MIDARETKILERTGTKRLEQALFGRGGVLVAACDAFEQCTQLYGIHINNARIDLVTSPTVT